MSTVRAGTSPPGSSRTSATYRRVAGAQGARWCRSRLNSMFTQNRTLCILWKVVHRFNTVSRVILSRDWKRPARLPCQAALDLRFGQDPLVPICNAMYHPGSLGTSDGVRAAFLGGARALCVLHRSAVDPVHPSGQDSAERHHPRRLPGHGTDADWNKQHDYDRRGEDQYPISARGVYIRASTGDLRPNHCCHSRAAHATASRWRRHDGRCSEAASRCAKQIGRRQSGRKSPPCA